MLLRTLLLFLYLPHIALTRTLDVPATPSSDGHAIKIDLNEDHSLQLLQHWMDQALSGMMAAVASHKLDNVPDRAKKYHQTCSKDATNVPEHAKCVVRLIDDEKREMKKNERLGKKARRIAPRDVSHRNDYHGKEKVDNGNHRQLRRLKKSKHFYRLSGLPNKKLNQIEENMNNFEENDDYKKESGKGWTGSFKTRAKREVVSRSSYTLQSSNDSPLLTLAKTLTKTVRKIKKKPESRQKNWKEVIEEVQDEARKLKARKMIKKMLTRSIAMVQEDKEKSYNVNIRRPLAEKEEPDFDDFDEADPKALMDLAQRALGSMTDEQRTMRQPLDLIRQAVRLGIMASGQNVTDFEEKTIKLFSPRLMSILPEEEDNSEVSLLSPSLFALHKDGKGVEKMASLADGFGLAKGSDKEEFLNFIMEAAGVTDAIEYLKDEKLKKAVKYGYDEEEMRSPSGQPLYFTKNNVSELYGEKETKKIDIFEELHKTFTLDQVEEQKNKGFVKMTRDQLELIYGPSSPYANEERLKTLSSLNDSEIPALIEDNIRAMAEMKKFQLRKKDTILSPVINTVLVSQSAILSSPIILSPIVLSGAILSPSVLGPFILSPWVFVPVVLTPRALGPLILNPIIFSPIVLSPLVLHPAILSPGIFNPFVLSPLVMSPLILSPQVFTPVILTPLCLNPLILSPMVGSPLILSPFVLSPVILSSQLLFAVVLSPYALSPLIQSKLLLSDIVLSPSWLS